MPAPRNRNANFSLRSSPGGRPSRKRKPGKQAKARCALCKTLLGGVPNRSHSDLAKLSKTHKRPERIYGGVLCSGCVAQIVKDKVRLQQGLISREETDFRRLKFITGAKHAAK